MAEEPLTHTLRAAHAGDREAADRAYAVLYPELLKIARSRLRAHRPNTLLDTQALVSTAVTMRDRAVVTMRSRSSWRDSNDWWNNLVVAQAVDSTQRRASGVVAVGSSGTGRKTADTAAPGTEARKIGDLYASYMDEVAIEAKGIAPLAPILEKLTAVTDEKSLARALGSTLRADVDGFLAKIRAA